jgi:hypothetical protein
MQEGSRDAGREHEAEGELPSRSRAAPGPTKPRRTASDRAVSYAQNRATRRQRPTSRPSRCLTQPS